MYFQIDVCKEAYSVVAVGDIGKASHYDVHRAVEILCPTCPTWSHFIQDNLKISIYLSLDKSTKFTK